MSPILAKELSRTNDTCERRIIMKCVECGKNFRTREDVARRIGRYSDDPQKNLYPKNRKKVAIKALEQHTR